MPKRWWQVLVWLWRGVITLEEGIFLFGQAWKRNIAGRRNYSPLGFCSVLAAEIILSETPFTLGRF